MELCKIDKILQDTAYVRMGGSPEELKCAEYLKGVCAEFGGAAVIEPFEVEMATMKKAVLTVDGKEIPCKGYFGCGSGVAEAELYYLNLSSKNSYGLRQCKGKIVLSDAYLGYWIYQDLIESGAVGFITYDGNANYADRDIDQRELRPHVHKGNKILGVNINAKDAIEIVNSGAKTAKIEIEQDEYKGNSHNVILDFPGEIDEYIVFTAHYDSTSLSTGAYDNMSGSIGLLGIAEYFAKNPHRYGVRFIWTGSEERGLLGAKAYVADHKDELEKIALNINLDMIGCIMGNLIACCTSEEKLVSYIEYMALEKGIAIAARDGVYSSDSTPFADSGVPAITFCRRSPNNCATIHNSYDTLKVMSAKNTAEDIDFITAFAKRMANARLCPVKREISDKMKDKIDIYLARKRDTSK